MASKMYPSDGFTRNTVESDLVVGNVIRMVNPDGSSAPFSDCVITEVEESGYTHMIRPVGWSNGKIHSEPYSVPFSRITAGYYKTVLRADGNPYKMPS